MIPESEDTNSQLSIIKHDIRNQLSNITLSVEQLKYELPTGNTDADFYLQTIASGCAKINELLKKID